MKSIIFLELLLIIAALVSASPLPSSSQFTVTLDHPPAASGLFKVKSPGKGPWARWSYQAITWDDNYPLPNKSQQKVAVEIFQVVIGAPDKLIERFPDKPYGSPYQAFQITNRYPVNGKFYAMIVLESDDTKWGTSSFFTIYESRP
ncbi:hypothetical protein G9A89_010106 [Geosiphon pyriformis]|nr:hypothetical protein G9A89_010106 [Geosiphon pyriformis]